MVLYGKRCEKEKADVFPIQRVGGKLRADEEPFCKLALERLSPTIRRVFSRADGVRPLSRKVMIVTVSGRCIKRQEEWYRKIFIVDKNPVSLVKEAGFCFLKGVKLYVDN